MPVGTFGREFIIFVVAGVVMLSMVVQGMLLPAVIRWAKIPTDDSEEREIMHATHTMITELFDSIGELGQKVGASEATINRVRDEQMYRASVYRDYQTIHHSEEHATDEAHARVESWDRERELMLALYEHQREVLKRLRNEGAIDMNALHTVQERLDTEEMRIRGPVELE